ncbi:CD99 molecule isoform X2 [Salarias fasciatus]|uniref:CD99 molecule isoform X2 n=1 Tax=Salarias fasciatus TaxID=181472 RepID=UPI0011768A7E|nr:CD99 antigen-like isoform X2 [Salarias fasciatus]
MKLLLRVSALLLLLSGGFCQELDLADAFDDLAPTPAKPKVDKPKEDGGGLDFGFDLEEALKPDSDSDKKKPADNPPKSGGGGLDLDLGDALGGDDDPKPDRPAVKPPKSGGGGGGTISDSDLFDLTGGGGGGDGQYKPDGGRAGGGGRHPDYDSGYDPRGGADQPQEASSGPIAGIVSAVGVALLGAASSYFAYQKKKLCFKLQGGADPEKGQRGTHSEPTQVLSNLLQSN